MTTDRVPLLRDPQELLLPEQMAEADRLAIAAGTTGRALMEQAGKAVAEAAMRRLTVGTKVVVLAGPGNNGGDGFVAARLLADAGYSVVIGLPGLREALKGDAADAAAQWDGEVRDLSPEILQGADLVIDALFGAGLDRPVEGNVARVIDETNQQNVPVIAVDLPSGVNGADGRVMGVAVRADETVTFFRLKPGHLLLPGRDLCGAVSVADIGISDSILDTIKPSAWLNRPSLWSLPPLERGGHKYTRGHVVVVSGPVHRTGAARLAARSALRSGAGLVTLASPLDAIAVNAAHLTAIMLAPIDGPGALKAVLSDRRKNAVVIGPGLGLDNDAKAMVDVVLAGEAAAVLDADSITVFAGIRDELASAIGRRDAPVVITPHEGEFARLFPELAELPSKPEKARRSAALLGSIVVLKGSDTVVAAPDGRITIADNAPPQLGTAGSGDVLAGLIGGLLAQGMPAFEAASAAVFLHGEAGYVHGRGLIAEDLPDALPEVFSTLEGAGGQLRRATKEAFP